MREMPPEMLWDRVSVNENFPDDEQLYCRIKPEHLIPGTGKGLVIDVTAFDLPDKSVNRSDDGGKPDMARHNVYPNCGHMCDGRHHDWAVVSMRVCDVQRRVMDVVEGIAFETRVHHDPLPYNRFHSEIRAFDRDGRHIVKDRMALLGWKTHYRWRKIVRFCSHVVVQLAAE